MDSFCRVLVAGRPGAGKGTQGARLAARLGVRHLSTGDLLRDEIDAGSPLGQAVERLVSSGRLVPTGLVLAIVETNLDGNGYVLDGYPRTIAQAAGLLAHDALSPDIAIHIDVCDVTVSRRLARRGRSDDGDHATQTRLSAYERETVPALAVLARAGILHRVDGERAPDLVERDIWETVVHAAHASPRTAPVVDLHIHPDDAPVVNIRVAAESRRPDSGSGSLGVLDSL